MHETVKVGETLKSVDVTDMGVGSGDRFEIRICRFTDGL